jgi:hypothetical protein
MEEGPNLSSEEGSEGAAAAGEAGEDEVMQEAVSDSGEQDDEAPGSSSGSSYATPSSSPTPAAAEYVDAEGAEEGGEVSSALQVEPQTVPLQQQVDVPSLGPSSRPQQQQPQRQAPVTGRQQWWRGRVQDVVGEAPYAEDQQGFESAALMSDPFQEMLPGTQVDWSQVAAAQAAQRQRQQAAQERRDATAAAAAAVAAHAALPQGAGCALPLPPRSRQPRSALVVAPPPPVIQACHQLPPSANRAAAAMLMQMHLACLRSGNALTLKLITAEDNMAVLGDMHEVPNIDVQFVMAKGCVVTFAPGAKLV